MPNSLTPPTTQAELKQRLRLKRELWGWASVFNKLDGKGDVIEPNAYSRALEITGRTYATNKLYVNHWDHLGPVGEVTDYFETSYGLYIGARLNNTNLADECLREIEECWSKGIDPAFSISMRHTDYDVRSEHRGVRYLSAVLLTEISLILPPCEPANFYCIMAPL